MLLLPVIALKIDIKVQTNNALHAYKPLLPAVKTGQPQVISLVSDAKIVISGEKMK